MNKHVSAKEIQAKLTSNDLTIVNTCLEFVKDLLSTERERKEVVTTRGTNLLGFAGIIAALTIDTLSLISSVRTKSYEMALVTGVLIVIMLVSIFISIWLAFGVRRTGITARPNVDDIFEFQKNGELDAKRQWLSSLIAAYKLTLMDVNRRVTYMRYAQGFLVIAIFLLLAVAFVGATAFMLP